MLSLLWTPPASTCLVVGSSRSRLDYIPGIWNGGICGQHISTVHSYWLQGRESRCVDMAAQGYSFWSLNLLVLLLQCPHVNRFKASISLPFREQEGQACALDQMLSIEDACLCPGGAYHGQDWHLPGSLGLLTIRVLPTPFLFHVSFLPREPLPRALVL